jgi:hypothetical protein
MPFPVQFVNKGNDGGIAHAADFHELFGQCGLAGVRMPDDAKGPAFIDFYFVIAHD